MRMVLASHGIGHEIPKATINAKELEPKEACQ